MSEQGPLESGKPRPPDVSERLEAVFDTLRGNDVVKAQLAWAGWMSALALLTAPNHPVLALASGPVIAGCLYPMYRDWRNDVEREAYRAKGGRSRWTSDPDERSFVGILVESWRKGFPVI